MEQKRNLKSVMETRNHSKNGVSMKDRMNRVNLPTKLILLCFTLFLSVGVRDKKQLKLKMFW
jgi:hypothetical protein